MVLAQPHPDMARRPLTAREVAEHYRCSPRTVQRMTAEGLIPALKLGRGIFRYDLLEIHQALRARGVRPGRNRRGADL